MRLLRVRRSDEGAVAVLFSVLMLLMVGLVALALDLGALRVDRRRSQNTADLAATAAGLSLQAVAGGVIVGNPRDACDIAWKYFLANTPEADPSGGPVNPCAPFPTDPSLCDVNNPIDETVTTPPYTIRIVWPVPDPHEFMDGRSYDTDGEPCERIAVQISRTRGFVFGPVFGAAEGSTGAPAVARSEIGPASEEVASVLLLDKIGCEVLRTTGTSSLRVVSAKFDPDGAAGPEPEEDIPGRVYLDSDGSKAANPNRCVSSGDVTITSGGQGYIVADGDDQDPPAPGEIRLFAMAAGATSCNAAAEHDCKQAEIATTAPPAHPGTPGPGIWPQPTHLPEWTNRDPADHRYNCKASYANLDGEAPYGLAWQVEACDTGGGDYVDQLETALGDASTNTAGYANVWTDVFGASSCNVSNAVLPAGVSLDALPGNWYVDCPGGFTLSTGDNVAFLDGNVVFAGGVKNQGGRLGFNAANTASLSVICETQVTGCLSESSSNASFVYVGGNPTDGCGPSRTNSLEQTSGTMIFNKTMVFLRDGAVKLNGGGYEWLSPDEGPFEDLALWADRPACGDIFDYKGGGSLQMLGVFFSPNATTDIAGGAGQTPREAQFFTWRMDITGGGAVLVKPNPEKALPIPTFEGVSLIR